jgi:DNA-binding transcriptional regulator YiaG
MKKAVKKKPVVEHSGMSGEEFWGKLQKIGFSQMGFSRAIKVSDRSVRAWIGGRYPVPTPIAMLVNLMLKTKSSPEDLKA